MDDILQKAMQEAITAKTEADHCVKRVGEDGTHALLDKLVTCIKEHHDATCDVVGHDASVQQALCAIGGAVAMLSLYTDSADITATTVAIIAKDTGSFLHDERRKHRFGGVDLAAAHAHGHG